MPHLRKTFDKISGLGRIAALKGDIVAVHTYHIFFLNLSFPAEIPACGWLDLLLLGSR